MIDLTSLTAGNLLQSFSNSLVACCKTEPYIGYPYGSVRENGFHRVEERP